MPDLSIQLMTEDFIRGHFVLWRCLHGGPLQKNTIEAWDTGSKIPWAALRDRNLPLLSKLTEIYGGCAVVAMDGERVVGQLRFYPKNVWDLAGGGNLCMQQFAPEGPDLDFFNHPFPPLELLPGKTLVVHCLMTGSPSQPENPYQKKGIGTRLVLKLIEWARQTGWEAIEAPTYADMDILYAVSGSAGVHFWEKIGFRVVETAVEEAFARYPDIWRAMQAEAVTKKLDLDAIRNKFLMRLDLKPA